MKIIDAITGVLGTYSKTLETRKEIKLGTKYVNLAIPKTGKLATLRKNISNRITIVGYKNPRLKKTFDGASNTISTIASPKIARNVGITLAIVGASAIAFPFSAIALGIASIGYVAKVASETSQLRNLKKVQEEEKSLERLVKHKHQSIELAHRLEKTHHINLTPDLAKSIGLSCIALPDDNQDKLSKLNRGAIIAQLKDKNLSASKNKKLSQQLSDLNKQLISSQKHEGAHSTFASSAKKVFRGSGPKILGDIATAAVHIANPVSFTASIVFSVAGFLGETQARHRISDQKQALKNSIELFRKRSDVPGYDNLEELHNHSRKAKLEAKALEKLAENKVFVEALKNKNIPLMKEMVYGAKHQVIFEEKALTESKELKQLITIKKKKVKQKIEKYLSEDYDSFREKSSKELVAAGIKDPTEQQILYSMKELAKTQAKEEINKEYSDKEAKIENDARDKGKRDYAQHVKAGDKSIDLISQYENQDNHTKWQKFKKLMSDIGGSFNIFKEEKLEVKKPHKLLVSEHLSELAIHQHEHDKTHVEEKLEFNKKKREVVAIHSHLMGEALLSPYAVSATKTAHPSVKPVVPHQGTQRGMAIS